MKRRRESQQWRTCRATGKRSYRTEESAEAALESARYSARMLHKSQRKEQRYYECRYCNGWHLTSQEAVA